MSKYFLIFVGLLWTLSYIIHKYRLKYNIHSNFSKVSWKYFKVSYLFFAILFYHAIYENSYSFDQESPYTDHDGIMYVNGYEFFKHQFIDFLIGLYLLYSLSLWMLFLSLKNQKNGLVIHIWLSIVIIGLYISSKVLYQVSYNNESSEHLIGLVMFPYLNIFISLYLIIRFLFRINTAPKNQLVHSSYSFLLSYPIFQCLVNLYALLGGDKNAFTKVFTETSTWALSQKMHPPHLDAAGHYLCTVAACGTPFIVKPLFIGNRNGVSIIVNKQLQIANAFECIIERQFPHTHRIIRTNYDKYGFNLSKKITQSWSSNLTYILMKPLEWSFLLFIYLFSKNPKSLINQQYSTKLQ